MMTHKSQDDTPSLSETSLKSTNHGGEVSAAKRSSGRDWYTALRARPFNMSLLSARGIGCGGKEFKRWKHRPWRDLAHSFDAKPAAT
jgi:hypothetical protein